MKGGPQEGPIYFHCDRARATRLMNAAINEAWIVKDSDPNLSARLMDDAHAFQRHMFAVRPLVYRPAPIEVEVVDVVGPNVAAFVGQYGGDPE